MRLLSHVVSEHLMNRIAETIRSVLYFVELSPQDVEWEAIDMLFKMWFPIRQWDVIGFDDLLWRMLL